MQDLRSLVERRLTDLGDMLRRQDEEARALENRIAYMQNMQVHMSHNMMQLQAAIVELKGLLAEADKEPPTFH